MPRRALGRAALVWFAILLFAILNGALRDVVVAEVLGPTAARLLSGIVLCVAILAAATLTASWIGVRTRRERLYVGALWMLATLGLETAVGYAQHQSWQRVLDAYTFQGGNLWPLVLVTTLLAPWVGARLRGMS